MLFKYFKLILNLSFESKVDGVRYNHSVFNGRLIIQQNNWWMCIGWDCLIWQFSGNLQLCVYMLLFSLSRNMPPKLQGSPWRQPLRCWSQRSSVPEGNSGDTPEPEETEAFSRLMRSDFIIKKVGKSLYTPTHSLERHKSAGLLTRMNFRYTFI